MKRKSDQFSEKNSGKKVKEPTASSGSSSVSEIVVSSSSSLVEYQKSHRDPVLGKTFSVKSKMINSEAIFHIIQDLSNHIKSQSGKIFTPEGYLETLSIKDCTIGITNLLHLLNFIKGYGVFNEILFQNFKIPLKSFKYLAKTIKDAPRIKVLSLSDMSITDDNIITMSKYSTTKNLQKLILSKNLITDVSAKAIAKFIDDKLEVLDLRENQIGSKAIAIIAERLITLPKIKQIYLGGNLIEDDGVPYLEKLFSLPKLEVFNIHGNPISYEGQLKLTEKYHALETSKFSYLKGALEEIFIPVMAQIIQQYAEGGSRDGLDFFPKIMIDRRLELTPQAKLELMLSSFKKMKSEGLSLAQIQDDLLRDLEGKPKITQESSVSQEKESDLVPFEMLSIDTTKLMGELSSSSEVHETDALSSI